jgi:hypothetical protein
MNRSDHGYFYILQIRHKPTIGIITISKTPVLVGDDVTLTCTAEDVGSPPAQYRWELPGKDIDTKSIDTLRISRAQLSDAGQYRCHPWNDVGQGQMGSIVLQVPYITSSSNNIILGN